MRTGRRRPSGLPKNVRHPGAKRSESGVPTGNGVMQSSRSFDNSLDFNSHSEADPVLALPPGRASLPVAETQRDGDLVALPPGRTGVARSVCRILKMRD